MVADDSGLILVDDLYLFIDFGNIKSELYLLKLIKWRDENYLLKGVSLWYELRLKWMN